MIPGQQHDRQPRCGNETRSALDEVIPTLATRAEPLLLDVAIAPTETFAL